MKNEYTEAEERDYYETLRERRLERERQQREDALDCIDNQENNDDQR